MPASQSVEVVCCGSDHEHLNIADVIQWVPSLPIEKGPHLNPSRWCVVLIMNPNTSDVLTGGGEHSSQGFHPSRPSQPKGLIDRFSFTHTTPSGLGLCTPKTCMKVKLTCVWSLTI